LDLDRLWASLTGIAIALVLLLVFRLLGVGDKPAPTKEAHARK
jgi:hypothetical protein